MECIHREGDIERVLHFGVMVVCNIHVVKASPWQCFVQLRVGCSGTLDPRLKFLPSGLSSADSAYYYFRCHVSPTYLLVSKPLLFVMKHCLGSIGNLAGLLVSLSTLHHVTATIHTVTITTHCTIPVDQLTIIQRLV